MGISMAEEQEVRFSGSLNTMVAITLVMSALSLAISVWLIGRVGNVEAYLAAQATAAQAKR